VTDAISEAGAVRTSTDERTARLERQLTAAQQITHIGSWEWQLASPVVTWSDELYRIYGLPPQSCEITFEHFLAMLHPDDRERVQAQVQRAIEQGGRFAYLERIVRADGMIRDLSTVGEVVTDGEGRTTLLIGTCRDVTDEIRAQKLQAAEQRVLEMIVADDGLAPILTAIVLMIEEQAPATIGSVLLLDESGQRVRHGAAPNLPEAYNRAIDGVAIGAAAGSCGTAMYLRMAVIVTDIESDPLWHAYRQLARPFGLRACWSTPICASDGRVLGTFALYYRDARGPSDEEVKLVGRATHLAGIAIQRSQLDGQLRALFGYIERVREDERTGIAREIHDELGQALTALKIDLAWVAQRLPPDEPERRDALIDKLGEMARMTDETIDCVRRISSELRPGVLDDLGLLAAIEWQAQEFERRTGIECAVESNLGDDRLERNLSTAVFRIFQEALTNVVRHARASRVDVLLRCADRRLTLQVQDNGVGIAEDAIFRPNSLGLTGMRERARRLGGSVTISSKAGLGTLVVVDVSHPAGAAS
jgi:PAS domain S-box-containing protein